MISHRDTSLKPQTICFFAGCLVFSGFLGSNFLLSAFSALVLLAGFYLLWRPGESPVLLFIFVYQWLQSSIKIIQGNITGQAINYLSDYGGDIETASYLSLFGLLSLAAGIRLGARRQDARLSIIAQELAQRYGIRRWFNLYLIALGLSTAALAARDYVPAMAQPLLALAGLKWAFFLILTYAAFLRPFEQRYLWLVAFFMEFILGFGGYFSSFKNVFFFSFMGVLMAGNRFTQGKLFVLSMLGGSCLLLAIVWTAVKAEYREFVSAGISDQIVAVDYVTSVTKLGDLVTNLDRQILLTAATSFVNRVAYVDFFGSTLNNVPKVMPHTNGDLWIDAITRPFMPRVLFPSKSEIHDSERTNRYAGVRVAGVEQGTSIGIGYVGESYIDFGPVGMMLPIFAFGWGLGRSYRWMVINHYSRGLLGMALASAVLFNILLLESSITKVFGSLVAGLLVVWLLAIFVFPRYLSWLVANQKSGGEVMYKPLIQRR